MSTNQIVSGWIAELRVALPKENVEEVSERLYKEGIGLGLNYEGTLLFMTEDQQELTEAVGITLHGNIPTLHQFLSEAEVEGLGVDANTAYRFTEIWYDGGDDYRSTLTLEGYREMRSK